MPGGGLWPGQCCTDGFLSLLAFHLSDRHSCFENHGDIRDQTFSTLSSEGQIFFLPRLSEKKSTGKGALGLCELVRVLDMGDNDCMSVMASVVRRGH